MCYDSMNGLKRKMRAHQRSGLFYNWQLTEIPLPPSTFIDLLIFSVLDHSRETDHSCTLNLPFPVADALLWE